MKGRPSSLTVSEEDVGYEKMGHKITDRYHTLGELPFLWSACWYLSVYCMTVGRFQTCIPVPNALPWIPRHRFSRYRG
jgi:hypothetical protein